jgi:hypothetical protein
MADRNDLGAEPDSRFAEKRVTKVPGRVLDRPPTMGGSSANIRPPALDRDPERARQLSAEPLIVVGGRAELVIEMRRARQNKLAPPVQFTQEVQERYRIRPAGQGNNHTTSRGDHLVAPDRAADSGENHESLIANR